MARGAVAAAGVAGGVALTGALRAALDLSGGSLSALAFALGAACALAPLLLALPAARRRWDATPAARATLAVGLAAGALVGPAVLPGAGERGAVSAVAEGGRTGFRRSGRVVFTEPDDGWAPLAHAALLQAAEPARALFFAPPAPGLAREALAYPLRSLVVADGDPALRALASPPADPRLSFTERDGRGALEEGLDVILVARLDEARFGEAPFLRTALASLAPGGALVLATQGGRALPAIPGAAGGPVAFRAGPWTVAVHGAPRALPTGEPPVLAFRLRQAGLGAATWSPERLREAIGPAPPPAPAGPPPGRSRATWTAGIALLALVLLRRRAGGRIPGLAPFLLGAAGGVFVTLVLARHEWASGLVYSRMGVLLGSFAAGLAWGVGRASRPPARQALGLAVSFVALVLLGPLSGHFLGNRPLMLATSLIAICGGRALGALGGPRALGWRAGLGAGAAAAFCGVLWR